MSTGPDGVAPGADGDFTDLAASAREILAEVAAQPDHPEIYELRTTVQRRANVLLAETAAEASFGVFAESSTGKSLLLGALVGNPLLLPVHPRTTTCNITVLRLHHTEVRIAGITAVTVEYLDAGQLDAYAGHLVEQATLRVEAERGDASRIRALAPALDALAGLRELLDDPDPLRLPPNQLAGLRAETEEMIAARRALSAAGLEPGDTEPITVDRLPAVVDHGSDVDPGLAARRSMVRRVVVDVDVPASQWPVDGLHRAGVRLVDVPGSGSGLRPLRDDYLRIQELDAVDTAVFLLETRPGNLQDARALSDLMVSGRRSRAEVADGVLVVAGKFDALPPGNLVDPRTGRPALPSPPEESSLLELSPALGELVAVARDLVPPGHDDRIRFVSPVATMALADELPIAWNPDDVAVRLGLGMEVQAVRARLDMWREVGFPPTPIGDALRAFTTDGGLEMLRTAMIRHAGSHGVAQRLHRLSGELAAVRSDLRRLAERRVELGPVRTADPDLNVLFDQVLGAVMVRVRSTLAALPVELADSGAGGGGQESPAAVVARHVELAVYDWPQWKLLFDAVDHGRVVATGSVIEDPEWADLLGEFESNAVPVDMTEFVEPYRETCRTIRAGLPARVGGRLRDYLAERVLVTADERVLADGVLTAAVRDALRRNRGGALPAALDRLRDVEAIGRKVRAHLDRPEAATAGPPIAFPLDPARALPWHPDSPRRDSTDYCAAGQVLRLRSTMVAAAVADCTRALDAALGGAVDALGAELGYVERALDGSFRERERLSELIADVRSTPDEPRAEEQR